MFCSACGANNESTARFCHACGTPMSVAVAAVVPPGPDLGTMRTSNPVLPALAPTGKSPVLAAVLSALIVGVGQFYNGDAKKGAIMLGGAIVFGLVSAGLLWFAIAVWSAVDAYQVAKGNGRMW